MAAAAAAEKEKEEREVQARAKELLAAQAPAVVKTAAQLARMLVSLQGHISKTKWYAAISLCLFNLGELKPNTHPTYPQP